MRQIHEDKLYKDLYSALDLNELELRLDEVVAPKDGEQIMPDDVKYSAQRRVKFSYLTKQFYDPEGVIEHQKFLDEDKKEKQRAHQKEEQDDKDDKGSQRDD